MNKTRPIRGGTSFAGIIPKERVLDIPLEKLVIIAPTNEDKEWRIKWRGNVNEVEFATVKYCGDYYLVKGRYPTWSYYPGAYTKCHLIVSMLQEVPH